MTSLELQLDSEWSAQLAWIFAEGYCADLKKLWEDRKKRVNGVTYGVRHAGWFGELLFLTTGGFRLVEGLVASLKRQNGRQWFCWTSITWRGESMLSRNLITCP